MSSGNLLLRSESMRSTLGKSFIAFALSLSKKPRRFAIHSLRPEPWNERTLNEQYLPCGQISRRGYRCRASDLWTLGRRGDVAALRKRKSRSGIAAERLVGRWCPVLISGLHDSRLRDCSRVPLPATAARIETAICACASACAFTIKVSDWRDIQVSGPAIVSLVTNPKSSWRIT